MTNKEYLMKDSELIEELHMKLSTIDRLLSSVFPSHESVARENLTELEHSVSILRNFEATLQSLRNVNPMVLVKQLMGL